MVWLFYKNLCPTKYMYVFSVVLSCIFYFQKPTNIGLQGMFNTLVDSFSTLFSHVNSSTVISHLIGHLARPMADLFSDASKKTAKVYNNAFQQKVKEL